MVYQGFKVLRRNPTFYNPRSAGMVALSYFAYSFYVNKYYKPSNSNFEEYNSSHPHDHDEKMRQFHERTNQAIRDAVLEKRAEHDQRLREEAKL
ncbi:hypothetical protein ABPG74_019213 [Tetrahymena malaccensis]